MSITSTSGMRDYITNQLGAPVITVELATSQLNNIITDAADDFNRYMYGEGSYKSFLTLNVVANSGDYDVSGNNINDIIDLVLSSETTDGGINTLFTPINIMYSGSSFFNNIANGQMIDYTTAMMQLRQVTNMLTNKYRVDFLPGQDILRIVPTPTTSFTCLMEVYTKESAANLYNNPLFKKLCVARAKILWGTILGKFTIQVPGGGTIDAQSIKSDGKDEEEKVMDRIRSEGEPINVFVG